MGHRAAAYTVRVRQKRQNPAEYAPLGDIDGKGSSLLEVIDSYLTDDFTATTADKNKTFQLDGPPEIVGDELQAMTQLGQKGVASDLIGDDGRHAFRRTRDHTELLRCGCLFRLPPAEDTGWLAVHNNNGQGIRGLLGKALTARFRDEFSDLVLEINPYVMASALREAIERDLIDKVKLVKKEQAGDRANAAVNKWVDDGVEARIELQLTPRGRGQHVLTRLLNRFVLQEDQDAFQEIIEFQGLTFDEASVEIPVQGGQRTFNIEKPESGHAVTEDLNLRLQMDGEPEPASVFAELRRVLAATVPS